MIAAFKSTSQFRALALLFLFALWTPASFAQSPTNEITTCAAVRALPATVREGSVHARLTGVITCYAPNSQLFFIQDQTAGVYVFPNAWPTELSVGDVVEIKGVAGIGLFAPIILRAEVRPTGARRPLNPRRMAVEEINTGRFDSECVQVEGVVRTQNDRGDHTALQFANGSATATILIFGKQEQMPNLVDSRLLLTGVAGAFFKEKRPSGFGIFVPDKSFIQTLQPPPADPFSLPLRDSSNLVWYSPTGQSEHRIRIRGAVLMVAEKTLFLREGQTTIRIECAETPSVGPGEIVDAVGFVKDPLGRPTFEHALLRSVEKAAPPAPAQLAADDFPTEEGAFLEMEGYCVSANADMIYLQRPKHAATVFLFGHNATLPAPNSRIRLRGVWFDEALWASTPATILAPPPVPPRPGNATPAIIIALLGLAAAGGLALRSRAQTNAATSRLQDFQQQLQASVRERERLARDLHDSTIQSVYAAGLSLENTAELVRTDPVQAEAGLRRILPELNRIIRDIRNIIVGLETTTIEPQEFKTALKSLGLAFGGEQSSKIRLDLDPYALQSLNSTQATELLHIAREALTNAARHGQAQTATVRLRSEDKTLLFTVEDDGKGFDPAAVQNGFGLRNMAKRAQNLGAAFHLESRPGDGAKIAVHIRRQHAHDISQT